MSTATKKPVSKKPVSKKPAARKAVRKKAAGKKVAARKPSFDHAEVSRISEESFQAMAADIDRQMKMLAEIDTRVLIAKDQLADFQEMLQARISAFQKKNAGLSAVNFKDVMASIRETRDEAAKLVKDSKAIQDSYAFMVSHLEKGRVAALQEMRKAEAAFVKKLHEVEAKVLEKADEFKKNMHK